MQLRSHTCIAWSTNIGFRDTVNLALGVAKIAQLQQGLLGAVKQAVLQLDVPVHNPHLHVHHTISASSGHLQVDTAVVGYGDIDPVSNVLSAIHRGQCGGPDPRFHHVQEMLTMHQPGACPFRGLKAEAAQQHCQCCLWQATHNSKPIACPKRTGR